MRSKHRRHTLILPDKLQAAVRVHGDGGLSHCDKMLIYKDAICTSMCLLVNFLLLKLANDVLEAKSNT